MTRLRLGIPGERRERELLLERDSGTRGHHARVRHGPAAGRELIRAPVPGGRKGKVWKRNIPRRSSVNRGGEYRRRFLTVLHTLAAVEPLRVRAVVGQLRDWVIALVEDGVDVR